MDEIKLNLTSIVFIVNSSWEAAKTAAAAITDGWTSLTLISASRF